jgi:hypothetical protein
MEVPDSSFPMAEEVNRLRKSINVFEWIRQEETRIIGVHYTVRAGFRTAG